MRKAMVLFALFGVLIIGLIVFLLAVLFPSPPSGRGRELRVKLLYRTDHRALLEACRELSKRVSTGRLQARMYCLQPTPDPEVAQFPKPILDLMPSYVNLHADGRVVVAMVGGLDHFGVYAYPENYKKPPLPEFGNMEIVQGLWYYDDGYDERPEDWQQRIDALRPTR